MIRGAILIRQRSRRRERLELIVMNRITLYLSTDTFVLPRTLSLTHTIYL